MKYISKFNIGLIAFILILGFFLFRECTRHDDTLPKPPVITIDTVEVVKDTVIYKPGKTIYHSSTEYVDVPANVDTLSILKDYYAKKTYIDTLQLKDGLGRIIITDTISKNAIKGRIWDAKVTQREITKTITLEKKPVNQVYYGLNGSFVNDVDFLNSIGVGVLLKTKSDKIYQVGVGVTSENGVVKPIIEGGIYWKIKLKK